MVSVAAARAALARLVSTDEIAGVGAQLATIQTELTSTTADREAAAARLGRVLIDLRHSPSRVQSPDVVARLEGHATRERQQVAALDERLAALRRESDDLHVVLQGLHRRRRIALALGRHTLPDPPAPPETAEEAAALRDQLRASLATFAEKLREAAIANEKAAAFAAALGGVNADVEPWQELRIRVPDSRFLQWIRRAVDAGLIDGSRE